MINSLADILEEWEKNKVHTSNKERITVENTIKDNEVELTPPPRDRSDSVDSGIGDYELEDDVEEELEVISLADVSHHCTREDGWMVIYNKVYDVTEYLDCRAHPGGEDVMIEYLGYDATMAFRGVGHSRKAVQSLETFCVGILPKYER